MLPSDSIAVLCLECVLPSTPKGESNTPAIPLAVVSPRPSGDRRMLCLLSYNDTAAADSNDESKGCRGERVKNVEVGSTGKLL